MIQRVRRRVPIVGACLVTIAVVAFGIAPRGAAEQSGERTFQTGITGSAPGGPTNPTVMMNVPAVRQLILDLSEEPVAAAEAEQRLAGQAYDVNAVVEAGLARLDAGRLRLALNYLSAGDQRLIASNAQGYGRELADLLLERRADLESAVASLAATDRERRAILYFLVGCMALDWDGLGYTAQAGLRASATVTGPGFAYTPWMKEDAPDISRRGLYWGSHNRQVGAYTFTTFGDHDVLPRTALPDLFFSMDSPFLALRGTEAARTGRAIVAAYSGTILSDVSRVLLAIHDGATDTRGISAASGVGAPALSSILSLLQAIGHVDHDAGGYTLRVAVLKEDARPAAARIVAVVRDVMQAWHKRRSAEMMREFTGLTALRQGVPFPVVYTEIWHYIFGYANLSLAERGLIADPYRDSPFRGFLPVLWASAIDASS